MNIGDKVIIVTSRDGFRGTPATIEKIDHDKYQVIGCDGYIGWYAPNEIIPDKTIMLSDVMEQLTWVAYQKDDDSYYDYEEEYFPDDEYLGWQASLNMLTDKLIGVENEQ